MKRLPRSWTKEHRENAVEIRRARAVRIRAKKKVSAALRALTLAAMDLDRAEHRERIAIIKQTDYLQARAITKGAAKAFARKA